MATKTLKKATEDVLPQVETILPQIPTKMVKFSDDPCFGKQYEQHQQCPGCWIKQSCHIVYRNRK